jgi:hypothetical protein
MVGNNITGETKPETGEGSKDFAFLGDSIGEYHIKGGNPVRGDDEKHIIQLVDIPHLPLFEKLETFKIGIQYNLFHGVPPCFLFLLFTSKPWQFDWVWFKNPSIT